MCGSLDGGGDRGDVSVDLNIKDSKDVYITLVVLFFLTV